MFKAKLPTIGRVLPTFFILYQLILIISKTFSKIQLFNSYIDYCNKILCFKQYIENHIQNISILGILHIVII